MWEMEKTEAEYDIRVCILMVDGSAIDWEGKDQ